MKILAFLFFLFTASSSFADGHVGPTPEQQGLPFLLLIGMFLVFYFVMWRPQSKRAKEHKKLVEAIKSGDEVVMDSGITGLVDSVDGEFAHITIAAGVKVKFRKQHVVTILPHGTVELASPKKPRASSKKATAKKADASKQETSDSTQDETQEPTKQDKG